MANDDIPRDETGQPDLYASDKEDSKDSESFNISDRSDENAQRAVDELKREFGSGHKSAVKNAQAVLNWADGNYPKSLEHSGLGNYPPLIIALNKLGKELEGKYREANQAGAMKEASLKAFHSMAREKINHLITKVEAEYATTQGGINK